MFGLSERGVLEARGLLCAMGRDSASSVLEQAFAMGAPSVDAALWLALRAPYPWPWLGSDLHDQMIAASEELEGSKLFCALIGELDTGSGAASPPEAIEALAGIGAYGSPAMACPSGLANMSPRQRKALVLALQARLDPQLPERAPRAALAVWAMPVLYEPARFGRYDLMGARDRGLLTQSCADLIGAALAGRAPGPLGGPSGVLLGFGPFDSILEKAPALSAPLALRTLAQHLTSELSAPAGQIACSVSFHADSEREWMRVALRPIETGFCLAGLDWPCAPEGLEFEFDRLVDTLSGIGISWCYKVEGRFGALFCHQCAEPIYPMPAHESWAKTALEAGTPPDGSHAH